MNVSETDGEIAYTAELPGLEAKDVDVTLADNVLTIRGEKSAEKEESGKNYRIVECSYGSFSRSFEVPAGADPSKIEAAIDKGVLTSKAPQAGEGGGQEDRREVRRLTGRAAGDSLLDAG